MRIGRAFAQTFVFQVTQSILSIATGILVARALGPAGQGVYATVVAGVAIGAAIGVLGQFQGVALVAAERTVPARLLLVAALGHAALLAVVLLAAMPLLRSALGIDPAGRLDTVVAILIALEVLAHLIRGIHLGRQRVMAYNALTFVQRTLVFLGVVALIATEAVTVTRIVGLWAAGLSVSLVAGAVIVLRSSDPAPLSLRGALAAWSRAFGRGGRALAVLGLTMLLVRADIWMLRPMLGIDVVGQVSIASGLAEWLWYVPTMAANLLFAAVAADRGAMTVAKVARAARMVVALSAPAALLLVLVGKALVVRLYGADYAPAGLLFVLLVPGMLAVAVHLIVDAYFAGTGFPPVTLWAAAGALLAKIGLNLLVVPRYGAPGAAVVTSAVYAGLLATKVIWFRRHTGTPASALLVPRAEDLALVRERASAWIRRLRGAAPVDDAVPPGQAPRAARTRASS
jgi:O-antigen/teichoic acid export membrane protein